MCTMLDFDQGLTTNEGKEFSLDCAGKRRFGHDSFCIHGPNVVIIYFSLLNVWVLIWIIGIGRVFVIFWLHVMLFITWDYCNLVRIRSKLDESLESLAMVFLEENGIGVRFWFGGVSWLISIVRRATVSLMVPATKPVVLFVVAWPCLCFKDVVLICPYLTGLIRWIERLGWFS